jgi:predicted AAA+ superfamily ATPase
MRYLAKHIETDLKKKMVFVGGPRQCGKTTMAKALLAAWPGESPVYLNWDSDAHRRAIMQQRWGAPHSRVVLDELHKFPRWKTWLKGIFDTRPANLQILVTGSARLDVYRKGGDSLLGRYHYWRLHPFCLAERPPTMKPQAALKRLMTVGGFPEPFLDNDPRSARRWRAERLERVLRDDVRDLESVQKLSILQLFVDALRSRVGSPVVLANIAQDLQVSPSTLKSYLEILERMYLIFIVRPYTTKLARLIQKPPKVYFFDNMDVIGSLRKFGSHAVAQAATIQRRS